MLIKNKVVEVFDLIIGNLFYGIIKGGVGGKYMEMGERGYIKV